MARVPEFDLTGFDRIDLTFQTMAEFDAYPLMQQWCGHLIEGNRQGVLSGRDGNDNPMPPLKYRNGQGKKTGKRRFPDYGTTMWESTGFGPHLAGLHDNLTTSEYRQETGPRLAPQRDASRIIKNLHEAIEYDPLTKTWYAIAAWREVVSTKGVPFLPFHFAGMGRNPKYDLRPVRPQTIQFCINSLRAFIKETVFINM